MKFTIEGFSQEKLVENDLDCRDAVFLRWFVDFQATDKMKRVDHDGDRFYWINHESLREELPILGYNTPEMIGRYLKKLGKKGALTAHYQRKGEERGTQVFYRIDPDLLADLTSSTKRSTATQTTDDHSTKRSTATLDQMVESDSSTRIHLQKEGEAAHNVVPSAPAPEVKRDPSPPDKLNKTEYLDTVDSIAKMYADFPPRRTQEETENVLALGKKYGSRHILGLWRDFQQGEPGKPLKFFFEDRAAEIRKPPPEKREPKRCDTHDTVIVNGSCSECDLENVNGFFPDELLRAVHLAPRMQPSTQTVLTSAAQ